MIYFNNDYILSLNRMQIEDMKTKNDYHYDYEKLYNMNEI